MKLTINYFLRIRFFMAIFGRGECKWSIWLIYLTKEKARLIYLTKGEKI